MIINPKNRCLIAGLLVGVAGIINGQASSTYVTFSVDMATNIANGTFTNGSSTITANGTFNSWGALALVQEGTSTVYTNTANDTTDANGGVLSYKFVANGTYENTADSANRAAVLPATSGASLVLPTPYFNDAGAPAANNVTFQVDMSQQIQLGLFANGVDTVDVRGNFNGWSQAAATNLTWTPSILVTNKYGLVSSNVYVGAVTMSASPNAAMNFKYVIDAGGWESVSSANQDSGQNRFFMMPPSTPLTLPIVNFSDAPYAPLATVTFSVDMSAQLYFGNWTPSDGVFCQGISGDWNNDAANTMTNNPTAANTNIYYVSYSLGEGSGEQYKFTFNGAGGTVYEQPTSTGGGNRSYTVPISSNAVVATVLFGDLSINDELNTNVGVTFSVDMSHAVQYGTTTAFNPSTDTVFVNGAWLGWPNWDPITLASYQLTNNPIAANPNIYSGTFSIPAGNGLSITYKYGINGTDNEAPSGQNHVRIIRSTPTGAYNLPTDTFGDQYQEPLFGELVLGPESGGQAQLSWLGAPNVQVQTSSDLKTWVTQTGTSGATWSAGTNSPNGLVSVTNVPVSSGNTYFRLLKQ